MTAPTQLPPRLNFPPFIFVPPKTTARIASSSISRPVFIGSMTRTLDALRMPAMLAHKPESAYMTMRIVDALIPESLAADLLAPTDSIKSPKAVFLVKN